jgi:hypothetical protein
MKKTFLIGLCMLAGAGLACSQNTIQTDSLTRANEMLRLQNDSLKKIQQQSAREMETPPAKRDTRPFFKRLSFEMSTSFWVNSSYTYFEFNPMLSYHFPKTYSVGGGPTYIYRRDHIRNEDLNGWGGRLYGRANFTKWLYGYTEYQGISSQYISAINPVVKDHHYVSSWFLSLGIDIRIGRRHSLNFQALYDLIFDADTSPSYGQWTYRVSYGF